MSEVKQKKINILPKFQKIIEEEKSNKNIFCVLDKREVEEDYKTVCKIVEFIEEFIKAV